MIEINLLPKELQKRGRALRVEKTVVYIAAGAAAALVLMIAIVVFQRMKISDLEDKVDEAKAETQRLQKDIELVDRLEDVKQKLVTRMRAIEDLDHNRSVWVALLEDLSSKVPDYLWLTLINQEATDKPNVYKATIEGLSYSLNSLATFMIQIMRSDFFSNVELSFIKQVGEGGTFTFQVTADVDYTAGLSARLAAAEASRARGTATAF